MRVEGGVVEDRRSGAPLKSRKAGGQVGKTGPAVSARKTGKAGKEALNRVVERASNLRIEERVHCVVNEFGGDGRVLGCRDKLVECVHLLGVEQNGVRRAVPQPLPKAEENEHGRLVRVLRGWALLWDGELARSHVPKIRTR